MNAKAIAAFLVLAGILGGYKLGQSTAVGPPPVLPPAPAERKAPPAIAQSRTERTESEPVLARPPAPGLDLVIRRVNAAFNTSNSSQRMANVADALRSVPAQDIPELMKRLRTRIDGSYGYTIAYALGPVWGEHDPAAALAFARTLSTSRRYMISSALRGWARADLAGALAYVREMPRGSERSSAASAILPALAEQNAAQAITFVHAEGLSSTSTRGALPTVFSSWGQTDPNAAAQEILKLPGGSQRDSALRTLARDWAKQDPQAALAFVQSLPRNNGRRYAMSAVLSELSKSDPNSAVQVALGLTGTTRMDAMSSIAGSWAGQDLQAALNWAENLPNGPDRDRALRSVASVWAAKEPQSAAEYANSLPAGKSRNDLISSITSAWGRDDPKATLAWLENQPAGATKNSAVSRAVGYLATQDPAAAAEWINLIPSESSRHGLYDNIAQAWARRDPDAAIEWVKSLSTSGQVKAARDLVRAIGQNAPEKSAAFLDTLPANSRYDLVDDVAVAWVNTDPDAAKQWALNLSEGKERDRAVTSLVSSLSSSDPAAAAQFAMQLPDGNNKNSNFKNIASRWAGYDADAALAWIETIPGGDARVQAMQGMISGIASSTPETAASYVAVLPAGSAQDQAAATVTSRWANVEPRAAADWVARFPEGTARSGAMKSLLNTWGRNEAGAASEFLATLPAGQSRTQAIESFVDAADSRDPVLAAEWVVALEPNSKNFGRIEKIARYWMRYDEKGARTWLANSGLPADRMEKFIKQWNAPRTSRYGYSSSGGFGGESMEIFQR